MSGRLKHQQLTDLTDKALARRALLMLIGFGCAGVLGACGKKGPLRLPEPPPSESADEETR